MKSKQIQLEKTLEAVALCRSQVMSDCEFEFGDSPRWKQMRTRLLRIFGHRGLEGRVHEIIKGKNPHKNSREDGSYVEFL